MQRQGVGSQGLGCVDILTTGLSSQGEEQESVAPSSDDEKDDAATIARRVHPIDRSGVHDEWE